MKGTTRKIIQTSLLIVAAVLLCYNLAITYSSFSIDYSIQDVQLYTPKFDPLNIKEQMTLTPIFTPDNALDVYTAWIDRANTTIDIQNQYITQFDDNVDWSSDPSPIVQSLVEAHNRGVTIRVQINEDSDSDDITSYFESLGISVRWMGNSGSADGDGEWLSDTHNKLVIIDGKIAIISSVNFSENAFTNNREAGMVIQNTAVATYYKSIFDSDWADGEIPTSPIESIGNNQKILSKPESAVKTIQYTSPTDFNPVNFTGTYNVTLFANPDNADEVIFHYLKAAKSSVYVSMYTISRSDFNKTLIDLKNSNPSMDIQVLISNRRVGSTENRDTYAAAQSLTDNGISVYNSTTDLKYYHNKYWIIDGSHVFVYSGNWSPRSVSSIPDDGDFASSAANRDMGVAIHDASDVAAHFKLLWDADVTAGSAWDVDTSWKPTTTTEYTSIPLGSILMSLILFIIARKSKR